MGNAETKNSSYGYRVIKVAPKSPAEKAGLIEFLDYIIDISSANDQTPFSGNYSDFFKIVSNSEDQMATMKVYNVLYRKTRLVTITPSKKWENADSLLGALVRYEEYATAHERVLRVAAVHPNSPASSAGLYPLTDYILGSPQYLYTDLNELATFIEMTQEKETIKSLEMYIFSSKTNSVRSTLIIPNKTWGGQGYLGCEFALGILNHLPLLEDSMFISNLGEIWNSNTEGNIDSLDTDDTIQRERRPINTEGDSTLDSSLNQKNAEEEKMPEFKMRPPPAAEIGQMKSPGSKEEELSHELTNQRMKLLHVNHHHKAAVKTVSKPFIKSGDSAANPFHEPKGNSLTNLDNTPGSLGNITSPPPRESSAANGAAEQAIEESTKNISEFTTTTPITKNQSPPKETAASSDSLPNLANAGLSKKVSDFDGSSGKLSISRKQSANKTELAPERKISLSSLQERQLKTTFEYNFFSKKLNGDYKILSANLFCVEVLDELK